eukprot:6221205-Prymnesium_polylepis.2
MAHHRSRIEPDSSPRQKGHRSTCAAHCEHSRWPHAWSATLTRRWKQIWHVVMRSPASMVSRAVWHSALRSASSACASRGGREWASRA